MACLTPGSHPLNLLRCTVQNTECLCSGVPGAAPAKTSCQEERPSLSTAFRGHGSPTENASRAAVCRCGAIQPARNCPQEKSFASLGLLLRCCLVGCSEVGCAVWPPRQEGSTGGGCPTPHWPPDGACVCCAQAPRNPLRWLGATGRAQRPLYPVLLPSYFPGA